MLSSHPLHNFLIRLWTRWGLSHSQCSSCLPPFSGLSWPVSLFTCSWSLFPVYPMPPARIRGFHFVWFQFLPEAVLSITTHSLPFAFIYAWRKHVPLVFARTPDDGLQAQPALFFVVFSSQKNSIPSAINYQKLLNSLETTLYNFPKSLEFQQVGCWTQNAFIWFSLLDKPGLKR